MSGNLTYRHTDTAVLSVCAVDAPLVITSTALPMRQIQFGLKYSF